MIGKINKWLIINSNGDWEHENNVRIISTDFPGWSIEIDLNETLFSNVEFSYYDKQNVSFIDIKVEQNIFKAYCSLDNFNKCLSVFFNEFFIEKANHNFEYIAFVPFKYKQNVFFRKVIGNLTSDLQFKIAKIPEIEIQELKVIDFEILVSNTYEEEFPKLNIEPNAIFDFDLIKLSDGSYPQLVGV